MLVFVMDIDDERRDYLDKHIFRYALDDETLDKLLEWRRQLSNELTEFHATKKQAAKEKNFEYAKWVEHDLIRPHDRLLKAIGIALYWFTGNGKSPARPYNLELYTELVLVNLFVTY